jgi:hypothetical protein
VVHLSLSAWLLAQARHVLRYLLYSTLHMQSQAGQGATLPLPALSPMLSP